MGFGKGLCEATKEWEVDMPLFYGLFQELEDLIGRKDLFQTLQSGPVFVYCL